VESIRCGGCNRLLAKGAAVELEIKCPRCGAMTIVRATPSPTPERPQASVPENRRGQGETDER